MKKGALKIAALCLAGVTAFSAISYETGAATLSKILPAAGTASILKEGRSVAAVKNLKASKSSPAVQVASVTTGTGKLNLTAGGASVLGDLSLDKMKSTTEKTPAEQAGSTSENSAKENTSGNGSGSDQQEQNTAVSDNTANQPSVDQKAVSDNKAEENSSAEHDAQKDEVEKQYEGMIIAKVSNYVNVRADASEDSEVVGKLYDKSAGELLGKKDNWFKINSGNVTGYVKEEFVISGEDAKKLAKEVGLVLAVVNTTTLKVREQASLDAPVLGLIPQEDRLLVLEDLGDWVKVNIEEGDGYISKEFVNIVVEYVTAESTAEEQARLEKEENERQQAREAAQKKQEERDKEKAAADKATKDAAKAQTDSTKDAAKEAPKAEAVQPPAASGSGVGSSVANFATQFVGRPYVRGGTSLTNGADCSGFVMSVYNNYGVSLPHSSGALRSSGSDVGGIANAQPGDIVCYSGHVGIYIGNGNIVHASTPQTGIKISNASYRQILSVRRIF